MVKPEAKRSRHTEPEDVPGNMSCLVNALVKAGVDCDLAHKKARDMISPSDATFLELYGRGGINREANGPRRNLNVRGLGALDMRTTKPDGSSWDFSRRQDRHEAVRMINELKPDLSLALHPARRSANGTSA